MKSPKKPKKPKLRFGWAINPKTRVNAAPKKYQRKKKDWKRETED